MLVGLWRGAWGDRLRQGGCKAQQPFEVLLFNRLQGPQVTLLVFQQQGVQLV